MQITVDIDGGAAGSIANSATLTYTDPLGNIYSPVVATDVDTVRAPQLTVTKSAAPGSVEPGDVITYTVDLANTGGGTQTGVLVTDDLPPGYVGGAGQHRHFADFDSERRLPIEQLHRRVGMDRTVGRVRR